MLKRPQKQPEKPLEEMIEHCQARAEAYIEARVMEMKLECPGVPETVLRRLVANRAPNCICAQAQELLKS
jgi:hypothetical protein